MTQCLIRQVAFQATTALNEQLAELKSALQQRNLAVKELERKVLHPMSVCLSVHLPDWSPCHEQVKAAQAQRNVAESRMDLVHQSLSLFEESHGDR